MGVLFSDLPVSKRVKVWLIVSDLTQADVAQELGVSRVYLTQIINGLRPASDRVREYFWRQVGIRPREWDDQANGEEAP